MELLRSFLILLLLLSNAEALELKGLGFFKENPDCKVKNDYLYLSKEQQKKIGLNDRIIKRFKITCSSRKLKGYLLNDKVRTHFQTIFFVLKKNKMLTVEVVKFDEPFKYRLPKKWLKMMLENKAREEQRVDSISGATLSTSSMKRMVDYIWELENL